MMEFQSRYEIRQVGTNERIGYRGTKDEAIEYFEKGYIVIEHQTNTIQVTTNTRKTVIYSEMWNPK